MSQTLEERFGKEEVEKVAIERGLYSKTKTEEIIKHAKVFDTPLLPIEVGSMQTGGPFWYIMNTDKPSAIKLYFTMLAAALTSMPSHSKARKAFVDNIANDNIAVWMPYKEGMKRSNIGSKGSYKDARDELVNLGLIRKTKDKSVYVIGKVTGEKEWKSLLTLKAEAMVKSTDVVQ